VSFTELNLGDRLGTIFFLEEQMYSIKNRVTFTPLKFRSLVRDVLIEQFKPATIQNIHCET
jgi:hypothetical protein